MARRRRAAAGRARDAAGRGGGGGWGEGHKGGLGEARGGGGGQVGEGLSGDGKGLDAAVVPSWARLRLGPSAALREARRGAPTAPARPKADRPPPFDPPPWP